MQPSGPRMRAWLSRAHRYLDRYLPIVEFWFMLLYYLLMIAVGVSAFTGEPSPSLVKAVGLQTTQFSFSLALIALAPLGLIYRWRGAIRAEAAILFGLAICSLLQGWVLIMEGGVQSGLRILAGFFMMTAVALAMRKSVKTVVISKADLKVLKEASRG